MNLADFMIAPCAIDASHGSDIESRLLRFDGHSALLAAAPRSHGHSAMRTGMLRKQSYLTAWEQNTRCDKQFGSEGCLRSQS
jgi:hypothetical protein